MLGRGGRGDFPDRMAGSHSVGGRRTPWVTKQLQSIRDRAMPEEIEVRGRSTLGKGRLLVLFSLLSPVKDLAGLLVVVWAIFIGCAMLRVYFILCCLFYVFYCNLFWGESGLQKVGHEMQQINKYNASFDVIFKYCKLSWARG